MLYIVHLGNGIRIGSRQGFNYVRAELYAETEVKRNGV